MRVTDHVKTYGMVKLLYLLICKNQEVQNVTVRKGMEGL